LDEKALLIWFEELEKRVSESRASQIVAPGVWAAIFAEMHAALESVFPPSHAIVRRWEDATSRARGFARGPRIETPELWIRDELIGIFRTALGLLRTGLIRSLANGVRAETVAQCLDQAEALGRAGYAAAAMLFAGGALETHLRALCMRCSLSWQGSGSIGATSRPSTRLATKARKVWCHQATPARLNHGEKIATKQLICQPISPKLPGRSCT
jgi:hypothetical protein